MGRYQDFCPIYYLKETLHLWYLGLTKLDKFHIYFGYDRVAQLFFESSFEHMKISSIKFELTSSFKFFNWVKSKLTLTQILYLCHFNKIKSNAFVKYLYHFIIFKFYIIIRYIFIIFNKSRIINSFSPQGVPFFYFFKNYFMY